MKAVVLVVPTDERVVTPVALYKPREISAPPAVILTDSIPLSFDGVTDEVIVALSTSVEPVVPSKLSRELSV